MSEGSAEYEPPKLLVYGDIEELTRGGTGPGNDGTGTSSMSQGEGN